MGIGGDVTDVLLHGSAEEGFDRSVTFARRMAETFGARLHVLYTIEEPLSAGWTAEMSADRLPDLHQAMEAEARERLSRLISIEDQERIGVEIVLRTGPASEELARYIDEAGIDLVILQATKADGPGAQAARTLLAEDGRCAVLALR